MIDSIGLTLYNDECKGADFTTETPLHLSNPWWNWKKDRHEGELGNLKVKVYPNRVLVENSLCKYYLGDNMQTLTRRAIKEAIEKLGDDLHLPMGRAKVWRADMGINLITTHPPYVYIPYLGILPRFERNEYINGILYTKGASRAFELYDKMVKALKDGETIPEFLTLNNVLRLENRYLRSSAVRRVFGGRSPTADMLYEENNYIRMADRLLETWDGIHKKQEITIFDFDMETMKDFNILGRLSLILQVGGIKEFEQRLEAKRRRGDITPKQKHDIMEGAKSAMEKAGQIVKVESGVEELNELVRNAITFYR